jgi:2,4-dienoyl-CoA reductase-like NADH-dependent reductase (Old Yellow Enzyme family)
VSKLFAPLKLRGLNLRNRVFVAPMCQYSAEDGAANDWHLMHLGSLAAGGAALVIVEATGVVPEGRITQGDLGLWKDSQADALAPVARFVAAQGAAPAIQLAHAGRKASTSAPWKGGTALSAADGGWQPLAPSPIAFGPGSPEPRQLTAAEVRELVGRFAAAATRAVRAGFQAVELHMAHGYLMHEFLSPLSNHRADEYGGALENRARFPLEVAKAVRAVLPAEMPLLARISATDWVDGGWDLPQSIELSKWLKAAGVDFIDCSSGGMVPNAVVPAGPGFQTPFAAAIRREVGIATGAVGLITEAAQAEQIVATGQADAVLLARELLRDPHWPLRAAHSLHAEVRWPPQYERAKPFR